MKKLNVLISIILAITATYLTWNYIRYGWSPSISHYAKDQTADGLTWIAYLWVWLTGGGITFYSLLQKSKTRYIWLLAISGGSLGIIGTFTGCNPNFDNHSLTSVLHVIFTNISIGTVLAFIIIDGIKKDLDIWITLITFWVFFLVLALIKHNGKYVIPNHTYWIEVVTIANLFIYLYIRNLKLNDKGRERINRT